MSDTDDALAVIEAVLRETVLPATVYRIRPQTDFELAVTIFDALQAQGFAIHRPPAHEEPER